MPDNRPFVASTVTLGLVVLSHAALTWPLEATVAFFGGGAVVAFVAEAVVINLEFLDHHVTPNVLGVPIYVLFGWTGVVYVAFRLALLATDGWLAVAIGAVLATTADLLTDHQGITNGYWTYTDELPGPRFRGVPWWNYLGWVTISATTAALALPFL
ncbi:carotenoid biosynthesis protein [Halorhabdus salina]|uniref:carotenoid biosynthesis protein n=1 Tax=Halorhabdus salina TaxID=2750670 RepID=UPI0015EF332C|nr:carotenoid biosynthesis protein [Halorhabdus salina]